MPNIQPIRPVLDKFCLVSWVNSLPPQNYDVEIDHIVLILESDYSGCNRASVKVMFKELIFDRILKADVIGNRIVSITIKLKQIYGNPR